MTGFSKYTLRQNGEHFGSVLFKQRRIFCPISGLPIFFTNTPNYVVWHFANGFSLLKLLAGSFQILLFERKKG